MGFCASYAGSGYRLAPLPFLGDFLFPGRTAEAVEVVSLCPIAGVVLTAEPSIPAAVLRTGVTGPGHILRTPRKDLSVLPGLWLAPRTPLLWSWPPSERIGSGREPGGLLPLLFPLMLILHRSRNMQGGWREKLRIFSGGTHNQHSPYDPLPSRRS